MRAETCLCVQGMTLDLIGLIQKWKSCKKPTIGRKWQASIHVMYLLTLWCVTYRDSMATPHCGYFTCLYGCGSDWNVSSFLLSNVHVRDIKCLSDNAMVLWSGGWKQRAISHENGLFQAVKTSSPLSYLDHRQPAQVRPTRCSRMRGTGSKLLC